MSADPAALKALVVASRHQTSGHQDIQTSRPVAFGKIPEHRCWTRSHRECVFSAITSQWFNVEFSSILDIKVQRGFVKKGLFAAIASCIRLFSKKLASKGVRTKAALRYFELVLLPRSSKQINFEVGSGSNVKV